MGARGSEHGEEIEKCRKFLKELCKEASGNQILGVGDSGEKGIVLTRVIMLLMVYCHVHSQKKKKNPTMFSSSSKQ